jgi:hypothetical protein
MNYRTFSTHFARSLRSKYGISPEALVDEGGEVVIMYESPRYQLKVTIDDSEIPGFCYVVGALFKKTKKGFKQIATDFLDYPLGYEDLLTPLLRDLDGKD